MREREKQEGAALDAEISAAAERINRTIDSMVADLRQTEARVEPEAKAEAKQTNYRGGPDDAE